MGLPISHKPFATTREDVCQTRCTSCSPHSVEQTAGGHSSSHHGTIGWPQMWGVERLSMKEHGTSFKKPLNHWIYIYIYICLRKGEIEKARDLDIIDRFGISFEPKWENDIPTLVISHNIAFVPPCWLVQSLNPMISPLVFIMTPLRFQVAVFQWMSGGRSQQISWENPQRVFAPGFNTSWGRKWQEFHFKSYGCEILNQLVVYLSHIYRVWTKVVKDFFHPR